MSEPTLVVVRNEVDPDQDYHCDAIVEALADWTGSDGGAVVREVAYPFGDRPTLDGVDGVVLSGSTAGVYEADDRPWIADEMALVRTLIDRELPTLGICFGHQLVHAALGGSVEHVGETCRPVAVAVGADPPADQFFEGVSPVVPAVHGDVVTDPADDLETIASADYYDAYASRHPTAPLWTVQFHPELTAAHRDRLDEGFGWTEDEHSFDDVNATRLLENFASLAADREASARP